MRTFTTVKIGEQNTQMETEDYAVHRQDYITILDDQLVAAYRDGDKALQAQFERQVVEKLVDKMIQDGAIKFESEHDVYRCQHIHAAQVWYLKRKE